MRFLRAAVAASTILVAMTSPGRTEGESAPAERGTLRVAVASRIGEPGTLSPLVYWGGFETKTAVFEPLVTAASDGSPTPALAESWTASADMKVWTFTLRAGIVAHDGAAFDADAVREHLQRWRGNPAHRWLPVTELMERVDAPDARTVRITLSRPWYLLPELMIVNPGHMTAPGSFKPNGDVRASVGTGPFRIASQVPGERFVMEPHDAWWRGRPGLSRLELVAAPTRERESEELVRMLQRGEVDLVADGEVPRIPRDQLDVVRGDARLRIWTAPGSNVNYLLLNTARAPFADRDARRRAAAAVDRRRLIDAGERGLADPATSMFRAPGAGWPAEGTVPHDVPAATTATDAVLLLPAAPAERFRRHAAELTTQLAPAGLRVRVEVAATTDDYWRRRAAGDFDVAFEATQGVPYDPWIGLQAMFLRDPASVGKYAAKSSPVWSDDELSRVLVSALAEPSPEARAALLAAAQRRLDDAMPVIPLFVPHRVAVSRADVEGVTIGANGYDFGLGFAKRRAR